MENVARAPTSNALKDFEERIKKTIEDGFKEINKKIDALDSKIRVVETYVNESLNHDNGNDVNVGSEGVRSEDAGDDSTTVGGESDVREEAATDDAATTVGGEDVAAGGGEDAVATGAGEDAGAASDGEETESDVPPLKRRRQPSRWIKTPYAPPKKRR